MLRAHNICTLQKRKPCLRTNDTQNPITVYYDGSCPLCSREINWYKNRQGGDQVSWQDVSKVENAKVAKDLKTKDAMERFYVRKADGSLVSGAQAFSELWLNLPSLKLAGNFAKLPIVKQIAELAYRLFLTVRNLRK